MLSGEQLVPLLTTLVCRGPGSNSVTHDLEADTLPTELPRPACCLTSDIFSAVAMGTSEVNGHGQRNNTILFVICNQVWFFPIPVFGVGIFF